jgi:hypothetical protein
VADSGNPEDLVSQVTVTGTEESLAKLDAYAAGGAAAFEKLNVAAKASAAGVVSSTAAIDAAGKGVAAGSTGWIANLQNGLKTLPNTFSAVGTAIKDLADRFQPLTQAVGRFSQRIAIAGAGAAAAGIGLAKTASGVAKAADSQTTATDLLTKAQEKGIQSTLTADERSINHAHSVRELTNQLRQGKIGYSEYGNALVELDNQERESAIVANQLEYAQERAKEAQDRLTKSVKDREAFTKLIDTFGGPLTQSLISFGHQVDVVHKNFLTAFSPAAASAVDIISKALTDNAQNLNQYFDAASGKIQAFLTQNGPAIQKLIEGIGNVFNGVIEALPGVIDFFNNVLVPTIKRVAATFNLIAEGINAVFGTRITGGSIVLLAILGQITGSFRLLFVVAKGFGGILGSLIGIIESVGVGIAELFGAKRVAEIIKYGAQLSKGKGLFGALSGAIRIVIPLITLLATTIAEGLGIALGPVYILILLVAAALIYLATKVDWKKFGQGVIQFGKDAVKWFNDIMKKGGELVTYIKQKFTDLNNWFKSTGQSWSDGIVAAWEYVKQKATDATQWIKDKWSALVDWFSSIDIGKNLSDAWESVKQKGADAAQWVRDKWTDLTTWFASIDIGKNLSDAWESIKQAGADAASWVQQKWTDFVTYLQGIPASLQAVWDSIKQAIIDAFNSAIEKVKGFFSDLLAKAKELLGPIIELLKSIANLASQAGDSEGGAAAGFASGGKIRGPGGGTDDRIPIWASNGEFMVRAASVAKYGTGFLNAINSGSFTMPGFAMGGLIGAIPRAAYADGGEVKPQALRPLNLNLFGEDFQGLLAPEDVGQRLGKYAVSRQNKSAGRKPAWVGRGKN